MGKQVNKNHYEFNSYCSLDRWVSYYYQIDSILKTKPKKVLEIGSGDGVLMSYLKNNTDIVYKNLDIADDINSDIVASVEDMSIVESNSFDTVCAFEVLEHLPFEKFEKSLQEMKRVSSGNVIISLPHFGPAIKFSFKLPFLPEIKKAFKVPFPVDHKFNGQHYWEIGKRGYSVRKIRNIIKKHFEISEELIPFDNQYHHFFMLKVLY